jgi:alpha,alpha-trehalase
MSDWTLVYEGFEPAREGLREALCTLGNGYFATRGAAAEAVADDIHYPGTYLAGGYNRLQTEMAGRTIENEDLVNLPNWLALTFRIEDGAWFDLMSVELLDYRQELDLRGGLLRRRVRFRDKQGRQSLLLSRRLVHMGRPHLAALETTLTAENWSGRVEWRSALDGRGINAGVKRYRNLNSKHLEPLQTGVIGDEMMFLKVQTNQSEVRIAQAARTRVIAHGRARGVRRRVVEEPGYVAQEFHVELQQSGSVTVEKALALHSSRDNAISECGLAARHAVAVAGGFDELLATHAQAWEQLWRRFDLAIERPDAQAGNQTGLVLRLHLFHLLQTTSLNTMDLDVGVPARGWHGEAYRGHVFWDELFIFPLLNFRVPEITRELLMYRYRRLDAARAAARLAGHAGAMYPWQSGSDGREESQAVHLNPKSGRWIPDHSRLQRHVNAAIAYNLWQYWQVTGDNQFLMFYGAEMILEIARFWASLARRNERTGRHEILGVMGPDEYHDAYPDAEKPGLDNNAYTNLMAVWVLSSALELLERLPDDRRRELRERLGLRDEETARWDQISRTMTVPFHGDGIISQFEGYEKLQEFDWEGYRNKYGDIHRLDRILEAEGDTANRYKVSKQGDVLMLFYLFSADGLKRLFERLGYEFAPDMIPRNIDYYLRRTSHGSTLSHVVNSWVLARSDRARCWALFTEALESDIADVQGGTTQEGIHLGAMAGTVDIVQRGYTGLEIRDGKLWFDPCLPDEVTRLRLQIHFRGRTLDVEIAGRELKLTALRDNQPPLQIGVGDTLHELAGGQSRSVRW